LPESNIIPEDIITLKLRSILKICQS